MTEEEAKAWILAQFGRAAACRLTRFVDLLIEENGRQNLIAPSTLPSVWARHVVDSAQLVLMGRAGRWVDIGTGGGFPGLVIALLWPDEVVMVEPRRRRADFLQNCVDRFGLRGSTVWAGKGETLHTEAASISARAVAPVEKLLQMGSRCARPTTRWVLPQGRFDESDLADLRKNWQGVFHVKQSLTDPDSSILIMDEVCRR